MSFIPPYEIMPAGLIDASRRTDALAWIRSSPHPSAFRRGLAAGWSAATGVTLTKDEYYWVGVGSYPFTQARPNAQGQ